MRFEFILPDIGEGVVEGEITAWHVKPGDPVAEDQPLVEVMTDKATVTIPSPRKGTILETRGKVGDTAKVHEILLVIDAADGGGAMHEAVADTKPTAPAASRSAPVESAVPSGDKPLATPATRKLARDRGVDLRQVAEIGRAHV